MYELEEPDRAVAEEIALLPRRAWNDYEAALVYILHQPYDADIFNRRTAGNARLRTFGLGRGNILYTPNGDERMIRLDRVSFLR